MDVMSVATARSDPPSEVAAPEIKPELHPRGLCNGSNVSNNEICTNWGKEGAICMQFHLACQHLPRTISQFSISNLMTTVNRQIFVVLILRSRENEERVSRAPHCLSRAANDRAERSEKLHFPTACCQALS